MLRDQIRARPVATLLIVVFFLNNVLPHGTAVAVQPKTTVCLRIANFFLADESIDIDALTNGLELGKPVGGNKNYCA